MALKASALKVGDTHSECVVENLSRTQIVQYAGVSGDYNPLHTDEVYTTQVAGYPSVFAHGMLTMGLTSKMLTNYVADGTNYVVDGRLTKFGVRFTNQVWPGDTLQAKATVEAIRAEGGQQFVDLKLSTVNQDGKEVVSGNATARIDP
jgi:acyl dehydratase